MKNQEHRNATKNRKRHTWSKLFARSPRVSAHLTEEHEWETDVPNIRLSRAFVIVLAIHVVAVGGIIGFELMQPSASKLAENAGGPEAVGGEAAPAPETTPEPTPETVALVDSASAAPAAPAPAAVSTGPTLKHIVSAGDDVRTILDRYGVTRADLASANGLPLAATQEPFLGQVLTIHNARRGNSPADGSMPVLSADRPRTIPSVPVTRVVEESDPAAEYTAENDPTLNRLPEPVSLEPEAPEDDFGALDDEPEYTLIDETTAIERPKGNAKPKAAVKAAVPATPVASAPPSAAAPESAKSHTVKAGDTAYGIGRKYGVSPDALLKANGISDPGAVRIGAVLRIPR